MEFKSRFDNTFKGIFFLFLIIILFSFFVLYKNGLDNLLESFFLIPSTIFLTLVLIYSQNLTYIINNGSFSYKFGFHKGEIKIENIRSIEKNITMWSGTRMATAKNGLLIKHNKFDEIYISPDSNKSFITELLKYNKDLKIIDNS